jgi:hypothetical protein
MYKDTREDLILRPRKANCDAGAPQKCLQYPWKTEIKNTTPKDLWYIVHLYLLLS